MRINPRELEKRIEIFEERYRDCRICPEHCSVDRSTGSLGTCGLGLEGRVYKEFLHFGEEPEISPTHTIYLAGCNFRCRYCSDLSEVVNPESVEISDIQWVRDRILQRHREGSRSISFVGGSPDVQPLFVLKTLRGLPENLPVVWNSNLWITPDTLEILDGIVDIFLSDLKYGPGDCDRKLSSANHTFETLIMLMGLIQQKGIKLMLRHLLLPGHGQCCTLPILDELSKNFPGIYLNLMTGYRPFQMRKAKGPLNARLSKTEESEILSAARQFGSSLQLMRDGNPL